MSPLIDCAQEHLEMAVGLSAGLYKMRSQCRRLLGPDYATRMASMGQVVRAVAKRDDSGFVAAGMTICKESALTGFDVLFVMSAAVELSEPTQ